jgi:hypothetical protein
MQILADGADLREVSDLFGHSSKSLTLSTRAHTMEGSGRSSVNSLARPLLEPQAGTGTVREQIVSKSVLRGSPARLD